MPYSHVPHFEEVGRINPKTATDRMPEKDYASALDHLVFTCVDITFLHDNRILLARRNKYPRKSWWIIGGRMIAGENPLDSAQRKAFEEACLEIERDRFQYIGTYSTSFAFREQEPTHNGSHSVNLTYLITLTNDERQQLKLTSHEYEPDYRWVDLGHVDQLVEPSDRLDQALLKIVEDLKRSQLPQGLMFCQ